MRKIKNFTKALAYVTFYTLIVDRSIDFSDPELNEAAVAINYNA